MNEPYMLGTFWDEAGIILLIIVVLIMYMSAEWFGLWLMEKSNRAVEKRLTPRQKFIARIFLGTFALLGAIATLWLYRSVLFD